MEVRPSSRKRKSNTKDVVGRAQKISAIKKAIANHKEGSTSTKTTTICSNCGEVGHFANRCPKTEEIKMFKAPRPIRLETKTQRARSATIEDRKVTLLFNDATDVLALF
jgi:hypothetical protein